MSVSTFAHNTFNAGGGINISIASQARDRTLKDLARWLEAPDPSTTHNRLMGDRHEGTGDWILEDETFKEWRDTPGGMLWIQGIPGNGKSVLCSTIIELLMAEGSASQIPHLYYYFNFRDSSTQTCDGFLRSILSQLLHSLPDIPVPLKELYEKKSARGSRRPSVPDLTACLLSIIKVYEEVRLFGDAFDECTEWNDLWKTLCTLKSDACSSLRFLFTSRPTQEIRDTCNSLHIPSIDLRCSKIRTDIQKYISESLKNQPRFRRFPSETLKLIERKLVEDAEGMFRWVVLQLNTISRCHTMGAIWQTLNTLPPTLDETYAQILSNIPDYDRQQIYQILQWTCFCNGGLTVDMIPNIYHVGTGLKDDGLLFCPETVIDVCNGLLIVSKIYGDDVILFSHFSVKEYLLSERAMFWRLAEQDSLISLVRTGITYFLHIASSSDVLHYSYEQICLYHGIIVHIRATIYFYLHQMTSLSYSQVAPLLQQLIRPDDTAPIRRALWSFTKHYWDHDDSPIPLSYLDNELPPEASILLTVDMGVVKLLQWLLSEYRLWNKINYCVAPWDPPIVQAVRYNNLEMIQFLVDTGADVNARSPDDGKRAIHSARTAEVVEMLIGAKVDIDAQDDDGDTALHNAPNIDLANFLIRAGANVNVQNNTGRTPLHFAASNESKEGKIAVKALIQAGSDLNARDYNGETPLHIIATIDPFSIAPQTTDVAIELIRAGANVNIRNNQGQSALHYAAAYYPCLARLLIQEKSDVNARDNNGEMPLHCAIRCNRTGGPGVVKALIEAGANMKARRNDGLTPIDAVEKALQKLINVSIRGGVRTPNSYANFLRLHFWIASHNRKIDTYARRWRRCLKVQTSGIRYARICKKLRRLAQSSRDPISDKFHSSVSFGKRHRK